MKKTLFNLSAIALMVMVLMSFQSPPKNQADDICGYWNSDGAKSKVWIYKSKSGNYWGKIVWLNRPIEKDKESPNYGKKRLDKNNPDKDKAKKGLNGMLLLKSFEFDGDDTWEGGTIYDPDNGKTYDCKITMSSDKKTLNVRGFVGVSLIGRTTEWKRTTK